MVHHGRGGGGGSDQVTRWRGFSPSGGGGVFTILEVFFHHFAFFFTFLPVACGFHAGECVNP